ncbi:MAG: C-GCAxxG-C-C family protein [Bacillota bacterium]
MEVITNKEEFIKRSTDYFKQGLNCAECVMQTYLDTGESNLDPTVMALVSGFGGGIGKTSHNTCGALLGACVALGELKGRQNPFALETPKERIMELNGEIYPNFATLSNRFEEVFTTTICHEMCKGYIDHEGVERKRNCKKAIAVAAEILADFIYE